MAAMTSMFPWYITVSVLFLVMFVFISTFHCHRTHEQRRYVYGWRFIQAVVVMPVFAAAFIWSYLHCTTWVVIVIILLAGWNIYAYITSKWPGERPVLAEVIVVPVRDNDDTCSICTLPMVESVSSPAECLSAGNDATRHYYHDECIQRWLATLPHVTCPLCGV